MRQRLLAAFAARAHLAKWTLAISALLIFGACGGGGGTPGGVLRVSVSGLPEGTPAAVRVIGEDKSERTLTASGDVSLPAGSYTVRGLVTGTQQPGAPTFRAVEEAQAFTVSASSGAAAKITYEQVTPRISPEVRVADAATSAALTSLVRGPDGRATLTFAGGGAQAAALKPGDLLVFDSAPAAPQGHYGRVVSNSGGSVVTEPVPLEEAIQEGALVFSRSISLDDPGVVLPQGMRLSPQAVGNSCLTLSVPLAGQDFGSGVVSAAVRVGGQICIKVNVDLRASFKGELLPDITFGVTTDISSKLTVNASASVGMRAEIALPPIKFGTYTIVVGAVPVVITPQLIFYIGAGGEVTAGVEFGLEATAQVGGGFHYDSKAQRFSNWSSRSNDLKYIWPVPTASMSVRVYAAPEAVLLFYEAAGPLLRLEPYVRFQADFLPSLSWGLYAGIDLLVGFSTNGYIGKTLSYRAVLFNYEQMLVNSQGPPPVGVPLRRLPGETAAAGGGMVVGPDNVVYAANGNLVRAFAGGTDPRWTYTADSKVLGLMRGDDGSLYFADFEGRLYALAADGTQRWKTGPLGALELRGLALTSGGTIVAAGGNSVRTFASATGTAGWSVDVGESVYGVGIDPSGNVWSSGTTRLRKHNPQTGQFTATQDNTPSSPGNPAIAADGTVYARTMDGNARVRAVNPDGTTRWTRGNLDWRPDVLSSPAIGPDGTLYICGTPPQGRLIALNPANGDLRWSYTHNEICEATPAVGADGRVYIVTDRALHALNADGTLAWRIPTPNPGSGTESSPVFLSGGVVLGGTEGGIVTAQAGTQLASGVWSRGGGNAGGTGRIR